MTLGGSRFGILVGDEDVATDNTRLNLGTKQNALIMAEISDNPMRTHSVRKNREKKGASQKKQNKGPSVPRATSNELSGRQHLRKEKRTCDMAPAENYVANNQLLEIEDTKMENLFDSVAQNLERIEPGIVVEMDTKMDIGP